jgi:VanZ family protein
MNHTHARYVFCGALVGVIALSLMPGSMLPSSFNFWDKAQHALGFFVLTWLACLAYPRQSQLRAGVGMLLVGGVIELAQSATGWRHGDWLDLLADAVGIMAALVCVYKWRCRLPAP